MCLCLAVKCPVLPDLSHGNRIGDGRLLGSVVRYSCDQEYELIPSESAVRTCVRTTDDRRLAWNGTDATCK